jgi:hypothetical protein
MTGRALSIPEGREGTVIFRFRHSVLEMEVSGPVPMVHWIRVDCSKAHASGAGARGLVLLMRQSIALLSKKRE